MAQLTVLLSRLEQLADTREPQPRKNGLMSDVCQTARLTPFFVCQ